MTSSISSGNDLGVPDSIFTWSFQARGGSAWGGSVVADSTWATPGDTLSGSNGTYTIPTEDERGADLTPFGLEDGQVFVEWYWDHASGRFLPTRSGAEMVSGKDGLGSEFDHVWTGAAWAGFGLGGQVLAHVAPTSVDTSFIFTFEATSGDRWMGELHNVAGAYAPGQTVVTAFGTYRILDMMPLDHRLLDLGTVILTGTYFDHASGAHLTIQAPNGASFHGLDGLGSERGLVWNGRTWLDFGQGGALQAEVPPEFRPSIRGFGFEGHAGGWSSQDRFPRMVSDVNGDGRADIVGFGNDGAWVALADGSGGFGPAYLAATGFGFMPRAGGWESQDRFPRMLADVDGDGRADIVGFGNAGVWVSLADGGGGFRPAYLATCGFGFLPWAGGWQSQDRFPRMMADVNGDRRADIVGFGNAGAWVSLADGGGGFGPAYLAANGFGFGPTAGSWASQDRFPRLMADVNGDGRADIVGFGNAGTWVSTANPSGGFDAARLATSAFGAQSAGWSRQDTYPRALGDLNGDGRADVVGFGNAGVWVDLWIG